jgi:hypothetical protein
MESLVRLFDQAFQQALQIGRGLVAIMFRDMRFLGSFSTKSAQSGPMGGWAWQSTSSTKLQHFAGS